VQAARTFQLANFAPGAAVRAGKPTTVSFAIAQPDGKPLTTYKRGGGPHTGVHLIVVSDDLSTMIHRHPPVGADGTLRERLVLPRPGKYRVVVDAYPQGQPNFQLFRSIDVSGPAKPKPLPPFTRTVDTDGYRVALHGNPRLRAVQPGFLDITVTDPHGKPTRFSPLYGALAHAIFFKSGTLDYFHTHVCAPGASGCTSTLGGARVSGRSTTPGKLRVGVLVPVAGRWRLFLQTRADGHVITVPFTLEVR
ncbi:MAG: hypothetical protein ACJ76U_14035, partial [Gaiellaceae bacterium]